MSFLDDINIYNDPIIFAKRKGTSDSPFKQMVETLVVDDSGKVLLTEIPNLKERVTVKNGATTLTESNDNTSLDSTSFYVDYPNGIAYFDSSQISQSLTFTYLGEGARFYPASRIWVNNNDNTILNAVDKFSSVDDAINAQKSRVDTLITSNPQPSEVVDLRTDRHGTVYTVANDRFNAEQLILDNLNTEITNAHTDINNVLHPNLNDRLDTDEQKIIDALTDPSNHTYVSLKERLNTEQQEIIDARKDSNGNTQSSLSQRFNNIEGNVNSLTSNINSVSGSLTLKVDSSTYTGSDIISKIQLAPNNILISADRIDLNGAININALDSSTQNLVNNAVQKATINLNGSLPTALSLDTNGITAYTSDVTKYARLNASGLYVKGGAVVVERQDGFQLINNGSANFDFAVDSADPPFMDSGVSIVGSWFSTQSTSPVSCNYYTFKQTARYLKLTVAFYKSGTGNTGGVRIADNGNNYLAGISFTNGNTDSNAITGQTITIDLGVPTGGIKSVYLQLYQDFSTGGTVYVRKIRAWLEG